MTQLGQLLRVPFARQNGLENRHPSDPRDVADHAWKLTFIWVNAFSMCWMHRPAERTSVCRCRT